MPRLAHQGGRNAGLLCRVMGAAGHEQDPPVGLHVPGQQVGQQEVAQVIVGKGQVHPALAGQAVPRELQAGGEDQGVDPVRGRGPHRRRALADGGRGLQVDGHGDQPRPGPRPSQPPDQPGQGVHVPACQDQGRIRFPPQEGPGGSQPEAPGRSGQNEGATHEKLPRIQQRQSSGHLNTVNISQPPRECMGGAVLPRRDGAILAG